MAEQKALFPEKPKLPEGFLYEPELLSIEEEQKVLREIRKIKFSPVIMHGVMARRSVKSYGLSYSYLERHVKGGERMPQFILELRSRVAQLFKVDPESFIHALIARYPAGAAVGWHTDAPVYKQVAGISLLSEARMRLRLKADPKRTLTVPLPPRSAYLFRDVARYDWQHHIPPVKEERYSVTFRTVR